MEAKKQTQKDMRTMVADGRKCKRGAHTGIVYDCKICSWKNQFGVCLCGYLTEDAIKEIKKNGTVSVYNHAGNAL